MIAKQIKKKQKNSKHAALQLQHCTTRSNVQSRDISDIRKRINYHNV